MSDGYATGGTVQLPMFAEHSDPPSGVEGPITDVRSERGVLLPTHMVRELAPARFESLPLDSLVSGKSHRRDADDGADLDQSLGQAPQLHNIGVRPQKDEPGKYEIIFGHRRVEALRKRGGPTVDAKIFDVDDVTAEIYSLEENLNCHGPAE